MANEVTCKKSTNGCFIWTCGDAAVRCKPSSEGKLFPFSQKHNISLEDLVAMTVEKEAALEPLLVSFRPEASRAVETIEIKSQSDFYAAVKSSKVGHVIEWYDDRLALLDCDYHGTEPTMPMITLVDLITPAPAAWWKSKGGGMHAIYWSQDGLQAKEWAAAAAISAVEADPAMTKAEVLTRGRVPKGKVVNPGCQGVSGALSVWCSGDQSEADLEVIDEWLADNGMAMGGRYTHEYCVIAPDDKSTNPSVAILPEGIKCFRCGFRPWSRIVGSETGHIISEMAKVFCWRSQAMAILSDLYGGRVDPDALSDAYCALLKLIHHPEDPRVPLAMLSTELYRVSGGNWVGKDLKLLPRDVFKDNYFRVLPGFKRYSHDERLGCWDDLPPDVEVRATYQGSAPIEGVPELVHLRGAKMWGQYLDYPDLGHTVYRVQHKSKSRHPYQYVPAADRLTNKEVEAHLLEWLPGLDMRYLKLCIAARGYAESVPAMPAIILAYGNSGSGKTTTPRIAAAMCDDNSFAMSNIDDDGRWAEAFGEYSRTAGIIILDEAFKMAKPTQMRERLIALNRNFSYRALYVGPVTRELDNVIVCTGITIPSELLESEQLGRRAVAIQLAQRELQWQHQALSIESWRDDPMKSYVSNCLVSSIIDEYFTERMDFITQIAPALGVESLRDHAAKGEGIDMTKLMRRFIEMVVSRKTSGQGRGWRAINRNESSDLHDMWTDMLCDDQSIDGWARSEKLQEKPLGDLLGVNYPVYFSTRRHGASVYIRFSDTRETRGKQEYKVTDDIWEDMQDG
jgi:hypothetical protein